MFIYEINQPCYLLKYLDLNKKMEGLIFGIVAVSLAIWAMLDVIRATMDMNHRILWMVLVILFPIVGPLIYFIKGKKKVT